MSIAIKEYRNKDGKRHREDGPAITSKYWPNRYYLEDKEYSFDDYKLILFTHYKKLYNDIDETKDWIILN